MGYSIACNPYTYVRVKGLGASRPMGTQSTREGPEVMRTMKHETNEVRHDGDQCACAPDAGEAVVGSCGPRNPLDAAVRDVDDTVPRSPEARSEERRVGLLGGR